MTEIQKILAKRKMSVHRLHQLVKGNRATVYGVVGGTSKGTGPLRARVAAVLGVDEGSIFDERGMARAAVEDKEAKEGEE